MMKQEFEKIAGYEVSIEDYAKIIEPMYMATELSKEEFVKTLNKKQFALRSKKQIIADMKRTAKSLKESCVHYTDTEAIEKLEKLVNEINARYFGIWVIEYGERATCSYPEYLINSYSERYVLA